MSANVLIAGDVCPVPLGGRSIPERLGMSEPLDLFVWTLDAAVPNAPGRKGQTCIGFEPGCLDELVFAQKSVAICATNHITDFGDPGVRSTLKALGAKNIVPGGRGSMPHRLHLKFGSISTVEPSQFSPSPRRFRGWEHLLPQPINPE